MNQSELVEQVVLAALSETFENLVFEEVQVVGVEKFEPGLQDFSSCWWAKIDMLEPVSGELVLVAPQDLLIKFAESVFGMIDEQMPDQEQIFDNFGELMNTFCGRLIAGLLPENKSFRLGLPVIGDGAIPSGAGEFYLFNCLIGDNLVFLLMSHIFWEKIFP